MPNKVLCSNWYGSFDCASHAAHNWAAANPIEFFWLMTISLMIICWRLTQS